MTLFIQDRHYLLKSLANKNPSPSFVFAIPFSVNIIQNYVIFYLINKNH